MPLLCVCTDHFQRLLNDSERTLQDAFPGAFGDLYTQNTRAFRDLYAELRLYYRGANLHLEETLAEFWARLLERLFKQLHPQLLLPDDYLDCLGKQAEALRPFGDAPRELRLRATRAFVAARSFVQGFGVASDVVRKVAQVHILPKALGRPLGVPHAMPSVLGGPHCPPCSLSLLALSFTASAHCQLLTAGPHMGVHSKPLHLLPSPVSLAK